MSEPEKPGFFSRLFGRGKPAPEQAPPALPETQPISPVPDPEVQPGPEAAQAVESPVETVVEGALPAERPVPPPPELEAMPEPAPEAPVPAAVPAPVAITPPAQKPSWWKRLTLGLSRTSSALTTGITELFTKKKLDAATLEDLEDILIQADLGLDASARIAEAVGKGRYDKQIEPEEVRAILAREVSAILAPVAKPLIVDSGTKPFVILMVGVNGSGKTTTIGKLAAKFRAEGKSVMLAAGDTFRAAAIEQLKVWGERTGTPVIAREQGADAAGLAFDALKEAREKKIDVLLIDTAGRLQNKTGLMEELAKVVRVIRKMDEAAPHAALLVLDATVGQNAISQVEAFRETAGVTGMVMTKLDGTARGGILVALAGKFGLPVHFIGVGEGVDDLEPFSGEDFARAIAGLEEKA
jgi:fused signal recognition particle receptor